MKISRSLRKTIRSTRFRITEDTAFKDVMLNCGSPRIGSSGTWVTEDMVDAYCELHKHGIARSVEVWSGDFLAGGLYGIVLGRVFVGESMFSAERDTSKIALAHLAACRSYDLIDCQLETPHLRSLGAETIRRRDYIKLLKKYGDPDSDIIGLNSTPAAVSATEHVAGADVTDLRVAGMLVGKHG